MKKLLFVLSFFISTVSFAQLENSNWCFRENAEINFNGASPSVSQSAMGGGYGGYSCASVSNSAGQLLFYTDGFRVWNRNHTVMPNGNNIGGFFWASSGHQATVIVPKPNSNRFYYVFTVNYWSANNNNGNSGFHYSVIDMAANGGNGDVVPGQNKIALNTHDGTAMDYNHQTNTGVQIFENRISSTPNSDGTKVWLSFFTCLRAGSTYQRYAYQYLISANGIDNTPDGTSPSPTTFLALDIANFPSPYPNLPNNPFFSVFGAIKFSPNSRYLCDANSLAVTLYRFDNQTGFLQFDRNVYFTSPPPNNINQAGYGVEFSPGSQLLYFTTLDDNIFQEKVSAIKPTKKIMRIRQSRFLEDRNNNEIVGSFQVPDSNITVDNLLPIPAAIVPFGSLQLALNRKIYICTYDPLGNQDQLGAIVSPDVAGTGCGYSPYDLTLASGTYHSGNLPQWVHKTIFQCAVSITPAGPIDYYIPNDWSVIGGFTLTSNTPSGNQWYRNGVAINGATNQSYQIPRGYFNQTPTEIYSCKTNGCSSNGVTVNYKHYGYGYYGEEPNNLGAKIFPSGGSRYFCRNTNNNPIRQFDQGISANYYWNAITTPSEGTAYISLTPGSTSLHSNSAQINIFTPIVNGNPAFFSNYDFIQGISDLNGVQKIIDLQFEVTPNLVQGYVSYNVCASQIVNIKASSYGPYTYRAVGSTLFDWEDYDFGPNSLIISPNPSQYPNPADPTNVHKLHIPGRNVFSGNVQVRFTANSQVNRSFYYNSLNSCYRETQDITVNTGCRSSEIQADSDDISLLLFPNPASNSATFRTTEKNNMIKSIEIIDMFNKVVNRVSNKNSSQLLLNTSNLKLGVYYCHIETTKGSYVKKLIIK
jgi:Secretion system C-terminal sorting domain